MKIDNRIKSIIEKIDITYLKPDITNRVFDKYFQLCKSYEFYGLCLPIEIIFDNKEKIKKLKQKIVTVIGFPFGYDFLDYKRQIVEDGENIGINEYDVVFNITKFLNGDYHYVLRELTILRELIKNKVMKVIIETCYLDSRKIVDAVKILIDAGADYVKTSTGFGIKGAQVDDVRLIKDTFGDKIKIKASGGIRTFEQAISFIEAGADRLGMSNVEDIVKRI